MALPIIVKNGATSGPSTPGQGSNDLVAGEQVDLSDSEAANVGATYFWEIEDAPIGTAPSLVNPTTATPHFFVDADASLAGSYRIKVTVNGVESSIELFAKPLTNTGGRIPSFKEKEEYDAGGNAKGWHEAETVFMRAVDGSLGGEQTSTTERQAGVVVPIGNSSKTVQLGGVIFPGSAIAVSGAIDDAVTAGTVTINLKINNVVKLTAVLSTIAPTFAFDSQLSGINPILSTDIITVEVIGAGYTNAAGTPSGIAITAVMSNSLSVTPAAIPDASNITKGVTKLSVAPAIPTEPVAAGTNDVRLSDQRTANAIATTGADVGVAAAAPPTVGQVLKATGTTAATWQNQTKAPALLTYGANIPVDASLSDVFDVTLTGATAQMDNPTNLTDGQTFTIRVKQDLTGGRALTFGTSWDFGAAGIPNLSTEIGGALSLISGISDGTKVFASVSLGFTATPQA